MLSIQLNWYYYLALFTKGLKNGLTFDHTVDTSVAKICPTSAMTDRVNGIPTMAKTMQKARPFVVTGAM